MKLNTQKIVAREFLVLIVVFFITLITFFSTYFYNYYLQNEINNINNQIALKKENSDSLLKLYYEKLNNQYSFSYDFLQKFTFPNATTDKVWNHLEHSSKKDSIRLEWKSWDKDLISFIQEKGYKTPETFKNFIDSNTISSNDIRKHAQALSLQSEIKFLNSKRKDDYSKKFSSKKQTHLITLIFLISSFVLFVLRYVFYGIRWSIKTLKRKT